MSVEAVHTQCCVVGGGPAGVMLGYLLARSGVQVTILEKHKDFFRDFRGDTVHPSTLELLRELGLLDAFLQVPHQKVTSVAVNLAGESYEMADFQDLHTYCRFALLIPQWDFLNFLTEQGRAFPGFDLRMEHTAEALIESNGRVTGVRSKTPQGETEIRADLVIACDGRHSLIRRCAQLAVKEFGVPIDVLWFRLPRERDTPEQVLGYVNYGKLLVLINRNTYYQAGFIIRKGSFDAIKERGLDALRQALVQIAPFLRDSVDELQDWEQVKLLSVQLNRLERWYRPGLLCIGDAAHAMSPVFGVGINLAIQDAVAAANILARALRSGESTDRLLPLVQRDRELRTRLTQRLQALAHRNFKYIFRPGPLHVSPLVKIILRTRVLQPVLLRVVGAGIVPERIAIPGVRTRPAHLLARRVGALAGATIALGFAYFLLARRRRPA
ncbi:MAG TPA: FAD-dependent oxidoreductase [Bryobacteraceae bacterium]|jgi:2-polyprenyl-6-methoxyphenol hydroxylase-like FAD-dependent oxidoreductase|nr:FAD-dependent oxidoreductase [Bryobacteraceae bacterium]